ncbi:MAG: hypothetical protein AAGF12_14440 [Myxococcota bacterium]
MSAPDFIARHFRVLLGTMLLGTLVLTTGGCAQGDGGVTSARLDGGNGGDASRGCGTPGGPCCEGWCEGSMACDETNTCGTRAAPACGTNGNACCDGATPCEAGLECLVGGCAPAEVASSSCGAEGQTCCTGDNPCIGGLSCDSNGQCAPPKCGFGGQPCCNGTLCSGELICEAGMCTNTRTETCLAVGGDCSTGASCCSGLACVAGRCDASMMPPEQPPPMPGDPCTSATSCFDCTARAECGFCDGRCVESDVFGPLNGSLCETSGYAYFDFECFLL